MMLFGATSVVSRWKAIVNLLVTVADAGFVEGEFYDNTACEACTKILEATPTFDYTMPIFKHF